MRNAVFLYYLLVIANFKYSYIIISFKQFPIYFLILAFFNYLADDNPRLRPHWDWRHSSESKSPSKHTGPDSRLPSATARSLFAWWPRCSVLPVLSNLCPCKLGPAGDKRGKREGFKRKKSGNLSYSDVLLRGKDYWGNYLFPKILFKAGNILLYL